MLVELMVDFSSVEITALNYIDNTNQPWESSALMKLSSNKELTAYLHDGFWKPMDTVRERDELENLWESGSAPWKIWK